MRDSPVTPQQPLTRIEISKDYLNFSAGHFTLFSATERENLHGHNFQVRCAVTAAVGDDGLAFDYVLLKRVLKALCDQLDERVLLPQRSPHLRLEHREGMVFALFADERIPFLERDVLPLPIRNVTIEELAALLLVRLRARPELAGQDLRAIELGVSSGLDQWAFSSWESSA
ncbi:6-carboxytetrahydropterin synthase [uncultured Thiocystis sp.]|jgi:6-pyruvoyltetrahydropterin/6-carboxytetrahydropterin synthase|uniref:6-pyruvoyl trahydropterin synthase family protein n=1 Tax=uncultured Thiocystis sp. TaxID=1202134 RepID=UPI0025F0F599|nr:6-carboxytetrahydropterin synthase [uncultured Thiocystis sp.]